MKSLHKNVFSQFIRPFCRLNDKKIMNNTIYSPFKRFRAIRPKHTKQILSAAMSPESCRIDFYQAYEGSFSRKYEDIRVSTI